MAEGHVIQRPGAQYTVNENTPPYSRWNPPPDGTVLADYGGDGTITSAGTYYMAPDEVEYNGIRFTDHRSAYVRTGVVGNDKDNIIHGGNTWKTKVGSEWWGEYKYHDHNDYIAGGAGDDTIYGHAGDDNLWGEVGNDVIYGGAHEDYIHGGPGDDELHGQDGNDAVLGGLGNDTLIGGRDDDTLFGDEGDDVLYGDEGDDFLVGGTGNDTLYGGTGNDELYGVDGNDFLYGGAGDDTLSGWRGDDYIDAGDGNDVVYGDNNNDTILGGNGDDVINGGAGNDLLTGGNGADVFEFESGFGHDVITDFQSGVDILTFDGVPNQDDYSITQTENGLLFTFDQSHSVLLEGVYSINDSDFVFL